MNLITALPDVPCAASPPHLRPRVCGSSHRLRRNSRSRAGLAHRRLPVGATTTQLTDSSGSRRQPRRRRRSLKPTSTPTTSSRHPATSPSCRGHGIVKNGVGLELVRPRQNPKRGHDRRPHRRHPPPCAGATLRLDPTSGRPPHAKGWSQHRPRRPPPTPPGRLRSQRGGLRRRADRLDAESRQIGAQHKLVTNTTPSSITRPLLSDSWRPIPSSLTGRSVFPDSPRRQPYQVHRVKRCFPRAPAAEDAEASPDAGSRWWPRGASTRPLAWPAPRDTY